MNSPVFPEVLLRINEHGVDPTLAAASMLRLSDEIFVNGSRVERKRGSC